MNEMIVIAKGYLNRFYISYDESENEVVKKFSDYRIKQL